eukprot:CAMPEP_0172455222 /NCGR_PEP_ID=MMETSP1065-20121228/11958_1 /TAXON_ID=265537 /ORGANISM="Amphiprora paludosa, Strain CCMP125" /LENGTH=146 /DNA_ID=CAMNT_0013207681 /DNA_START=59 /DNA_END=499 /DNA_ORIENTATION=-
MAYVSHQSPTPMHYGTPPGSQQSFHSPSQHSLAGSSQGSTSSHNGAEMAFVQLDPQSEDLAQQRSMALLNGLVSSGVQEKPPRSLSSTRPRTKPEPKLAETTRPLKEQDDPNDPETIAGMKCQLDVERENWARKRALFLLEGGHFS